MLSSTTWRWRARHPKDAAVDPRQLFSSRDDGRAVVGTRGERLDVEGHIRPAPPRGLAPEVLDVMPQQHREQLDGVVAIARDRSRLRQPQEGDEALLDCIESILRVEAALARIGEQPLAVRVDELCNPPEKPGRRVETAVSCLLVVRCLVVLERTFGASHVHHVPIGRVRAKRYTTSREISPRRRSTGPRRAPNPECGQASMPSERGTSSAI